MARGISLHIGLNAVDPSHYSGWDGRLRACEADAEDMQRIAKACGYETHLALTDKATSAAVLKAFADASRQLSSGDVFLLSYSGHGGQVPDVNGDETDGMDETWCLFDRMMLDDELYRCWSEFQPGVRVFVLSDSCHSGTVARMYMDRGIQAEMFGKDAPTFRAIPPEIAEKTYGEHTIFYDSIQWANSRGDDQPVKASVILISGCQDNQTSADGLQNGLFTGTLKKVWNEGAFKGDAYSFCRDIVRLMPPSQTPNYYTVGAPNPEFEAAKPFELTQSRARGRGDRGMAKCRLVIDVDADLREDELRKFIQNEGCEAMVAACQQAKELVGQVLDNAPRIPRDGSISCTADSHGTVSCTGTIHFG